MDLAIGAKDVFVMMSLFAKDGTAKIVPQLGYPATGLGCVSRVYTDHGVFHIEDGGVRLRQAYGLSAEEIQDRLDFELLTD